jgi:hypothetical protein
MEGIILCKHLNEDVLVFMNEAPDALVFFFKHRRWVDVRRYNGPGSAGAYCEGVMNFMAL